MIQHLIVSLVAVFLCFGCATDPEPKPTFQDGTRVVILNSLEPYLTHRHITIDRINSFTRQIKVDWDLPAYVDTQLADSLKMDKRFVVVPIRSPQVQSRLKQLSDQIGVAATRRSISQDLVDFIESMGIDLADGQEHLMGYIISRLAKYFNTYSYRRILFRY